MYKCLKGIECNFYIKIYSQSEVEEIEKKIREELKMFPEVNGHMLEFVKEKYRVSPKDMRKILGAKYVDYSKAEKQDGYIKITAKEPQKQKEEIVKKWKHKDTITNKSICNIMKEYHLTYDEVGEIFGLPKKEIQLIQTGQKKKVNINLYSEEDREECWKKIGNDKKYKSSKKIIEQIAKQEKISTQKVGKIFNITQNRLNKLMKEEQLTVRINNENLKKKVEKIAIDLKYLPNNGERYYKKDEIHFMAVFYQIQVDDFFYYLAKGKTEYDTYQEAFRNNPKGVWLIGKKIKLSNEYEEANHQFLEYCIGKTAEDLRIQYACNFADKEDFKSEAFEYILRNGGFYEKNLYYNPKRLNDTLVKNVAFVMRSYYARLPKELGLTLTYDGKEYENQELLEDNRYNPEICCLEEMYSYLDEIEPLHQSIVKDIKRNDWFVIDYPKQAFSKIARKHKMTNEMFGRTIEEIMAFVIKNQLVKITKDGKVISRFFVDEEDEE